MAGITAVSWPPDGPARSEMPGAGAVLRHVVVKAGHVAGRHQHDHEQFLFVVSGGGRLLCEEGNIDLAPGTALDLPRAAWHSAEFPSDTVLIEVNLKQ